MRIRGSPAGKGAANRRQSDGKLEVVSGGRQADRASSDGGLPGDRWRRGRADPGLGSYCDPYRLLGFLGCMFVLTGAVVVAVILWALNKPSPGEMGPRLSEHSGRSFQGSSGS